MTLTGVSLATVTLWAAMQAFEQRRTADEIRSLRSDLGALRRGADECMAILAREESELGRFTRRVDSLRAGVRAEETANPGGIPEAEYEAYMETYEAYNASVPVWAARADSLQARQARCTITVEDHNHLADSLRTLAEAGRPQPGPTG